MHFLMGSIPSRPTQGSQFLLPCGADPCCLFHIPTSPPLASRLSAHVTPPHTFQPVAGEPPHAEEPTGHLVTNSGRWWVRSNRARRPAPFRLALGSPHTTTAAIKPFPASALRGRGHRILLERLCPLLWGPRHTGSTRAARTGQDKKITWQGPTGQMRLTPPNPVPPLKGSTHPASQSESLEGHSV